MKIQGNVAIVTGASEGIGRAAAIELANRGAKVVVVSRSKDKLDELAASLPDALAVPADMTDDQSVKDMVKAVMDHYGRIDILVNNAGRALIGNVDDIEIEDFKAVMDLNVYGPLRAMQAVIPIMREQGGGMILNVSSSVSKAAYPGIGAYATTKYALNGLSLTARNELEDDNIAVSLMYPNATETGFTKNSIRSKNATFNGPMHADPPEKVAQKICQAIEKEPAEQYM